MVPSYFCGAEERFVPEEHIGSLEGSGEEVARQRRLEEIRRERRRLELDLRGKAIEYNEWKEEQRRISRQRISELPETIISIPWPVNLRGLAKLTLGLHSLLPLWRLVFDTRENVSPRERLRDYANAVVPKWLSVGARGGLEWIGSLRKSIDYNRAKKGINLRIVSLRDEVKRLASPRSEEPKPGVDDQEGRIPAETAQDVCVAVQKLLDRLDEGIREDDADGRIDKGNLKPVTDGTAIELRWEREMERIVNNKGETEGSRVKQIHIIHGAGEAVRIMAGTVRRYIEEKKDLDARGSKDCYHLDKWFEEYERTLQQVRSRCPGIQVPQKMAEVMQKCQREDPRNKICPELLQAIKKDIDSVKDNYEAVRNANSRGDMTWCETALAELHEAQNRLRKDSDRYRNECASYSHPKINEQYKEDLVKAVDKTLALKGQCEQPRPRLPSVDICARAQLLANKLADPSVHRYDSRLDGRPVDWVIEAWNKQLNQEGCSQADLEKARVIAGHLLNWSTFRSSNHSMPHSSYAHGMREWANKARGECPGIVLPE